MEPDRTIPDTAFAPAARAGEDLLAWQRNAFLSDATATVLLEAMPGPAVVLNRQRQVIASNLQLQAMFSPAECEKLVGRRLGEVLGCVRAQERATGCGTTPACAQCGAVQAILESLSTRGRSVKDCRIRTSFRTAAGSLDFRVFATFGEIGGEELVVVALLDISAEKRREVLERTLIHDFDGAKADAQMYADHLATGELTPEDEAAFRQEFSDLSSRVLEQIESHRQLLAAESGELDVRVRKTQLRELLEQRVAACRQTGVGRRREIELSTDGPEALDTDPDQLARVVDGLLRNALEATPEGGRVDLVGISDGSRVTISVRNAGVIPADVQSQIFQRSFSTKRGEGRGIGTYSVKLLVERYLEGSVDFVSDEVHGTVFTVSLPVRPSLDQAA